MNQIAKTILITFATLLLVPCDFGLGQTSNLNLESAREKAFRTNQSSRYDGRITKSFTEPIEQSTIATSVPGVIQTVSIKEGEKVAKGAQLAVIHHGVLLAEKKIAIARSNFVAKLDAARANLELKRERKENVESLLSTGHINQYELDELKSEYEKAQAEFRAEENAQKLNQLQIEKIQAEIDDRFIRSPISGFVTAIHKRIGEHVSAAAPQFATVVRVDQLKVRFYLDEVALSDLQIGAIVNVAIGANQESRKAEVIFVSPTIDPDSGTGRVDVKIDNQNLKLRSGTVCRWVAVETDSRTAERTGSNPPRGVR